jgi:apolipoprotein N-acyltransferase
MMRDWRRVGAIVFAVLAVVELGDFSGLVPGYFSPVSYADLTGLSTGAQLVRLTILTLLSVGIVAVSGATALGLYRLAGWTQRSAQITAALLSLYGLYQIVSALVQLGKNQTGIALVGAVYILIGLAAVWLERKASRAD